MNYKLNPTECQSAFEELYRRSPIPITVRSACNSSISSINKSIFKSPQPLCHNQLISPRPLVTSTSGPRLDPKAQVFESLKKPNNAKSKSDLLLNGIDGKSQHQEQTMTDGGEGESASDQQGKYGKGRQSTHIQPDTSTADVRPDQGDPTAKAASSKEDEDDEDDHFINNFFSKKAPKDFDSVSQAEDAEGEETCQDADVEDGSEVSSQEDEMFPRMQRQKRGKRGGDAAPIKLYEWIVKPVAKTTNVRGICLDGRKDKTIDEYWQTGMVTMRHSATIVATASGSRYHLIGPMDLYEAVEAGMTPEVAKKFKRGFPVNWIHVLEEFFASLDHEDEGSTVEEETQYSQQRQGRELTKLRSVAGKRPHDQFYLDSADSETDAHLQPQEVQADELPRRNARSCDARNKYANKSSESNSNSQRGESSSEDIFKPSENAEVDKCFQGSRKNQETVVLSSSQEEVSAGDKEVEVRGETVTKLHLWIIKPMHGKSLGICLEGQRDREEEYWHSSVISDRLDQKRVVTNSGSVYQLVGPIQKLDALEAGIPEKMVKAFQNGFPKNWKTLLGKYYDPHSGSVSESEASEATTASSVQNRKQKPKKARTLTRKKRSKMVEEPIDLNNTVCTPHGKLVDLKHVPKTRSGRQVMPQLAWWVGQRRSYDASGNMLEITYGTAHAESYMKQSYTDLKTRSLSTRRSYTVNTSSVSTSRKKSASVESQVLSVIDKQKQERTSKTKKPSQETCYNKNNKRRQSKLDMIPVVPLTEMKVKGGTRLSESSECEDNGESQNDEVKPTRQTSSKRRILDEESSSEEEETNSKKKLSAKSKRQPAKAKKVQPSKKRKSAESSSESEVMIKKPRRTQVIEDSDDETSASQSDVPKPNQKTVKNNKTKSKKEQAKAAKCDWGKSEIKRLYKAIERTSEHHPHFWDVVAESVETRSPDECRIFHDNSDNHVNTEEKNTKVKPKAKSKKGKSKKETSEDNDFFQATPFRPSNNKKSKTFNLTADETVAFEDECIPTPGALHKTPIVKDIQSLRLEKSILHKSRLEKQDTAEETETQRKPAAKDKKPKAKSKTENNGIEGLTAGKGTLKRKEQLRDIYNKHNEGKEEDDIFQATPGRHANHKKKVPQMFTLTEEEELEFESGCMPTPGIRHKTPIVQNSHSSRFNKIPNSSAKTVTTPWLNNPNRKTTDQVIAQNQRQGRKQNKTKDAKGSRTPRATGAVKKSGALKTLFGSDTTLSNLFEEVNDAEPDDEEEEDYYWSDQDL